MKSKWIFTSALAALSLAVPTAAQTSTASDAASSTTTTVKKKVVKARRPSAQQIADAKAKGLVWVNTRKKVYHQADSAFYGKTRYGKFMTKDEAKKEGYRAPRMLTAKKAPKTTTKATEAH
jgi:hypothetical protein